MPTSGSSEGDRRVVAVACSGGRDSLALLHACLRIAAPMGLHVAALHVHHGLQPQADAWAAAIERRCRHWARIGWPVSGHVARLALSPGRGQSIEAAARQGRYAALSRLAHEAGATLVLLGHHRRDQAETVLLQALRGAGAAGLAAMPRTIERDGLVWARPWLEHPREAIEAYARAHRLRFVDDASNADARYARNRLRLQVWPALTAAFGQAELALAQVATQAADAAAVLDDVAHADLAALDDGRTGLPLAGWGKLSPARQRNVLRLWCRLQSGRPAARTLIERLATETAQTSEGSWPGNGGSWRAHRGRLLWVADQASPATPALLRTGHARQPRMEQKAQTLQLRGETSGSITGAGRWPVPHWAGWLDVVALPAADASDPAAPAGISMELLRSLHPRARTGGERLQLGPGRPPRSLKKQFQAADVPAWARQAPLWWAGDQLVYVPLLGLDSRCHAPTDQPRFALRWHAAGEVAADDAAAPSSEGSAAD